MADRKLSKTEQAYQNQVDATRDTRMNWWREARFGMFVHWGLYAQLGRHEWAMNRERIPVKEYEKLAATWKPKPQAAREWAKLAKNAGMKYMVLTTKHHEGFLLWDSKMTGYNATKCGPGRDLVREYVEACREFGLRVGLYYSLMDWHHPDGARCLKDENARRRFLDFTQGCVRELCTNYGKIDILWYDVSWPLESPQAWESYQMNALARQLQPDIIINDRSQIPEDFGTPEEHVTAAGKGRDWEACMTSNGSWAGNRRGRRNGALRAVYWTCCAPVPRAAAICCSTSARNRTGPCRKKRRNTLPPSANGSGRTAAWSMVGPTALRTWNGCRPGPGRAEARRSFSG